MIIATKKFFQKLVDGIGKLNLLAFDNGMQMKADKEVKRDLEAVRDALWDIRKTLCQIEKTLDWAAQQPNDILDKWGGAAIPDDLKPQKPEPREDWISGPETARIIGWQTCNAKMLMDAGITFRQARKGAKLSVCRSSVQDYIQRRAEKKRV